MLFFALSLLLGTGYAQYKAVATFTTAESNIAGTVELTGGKLTINLDLTGLTDANIQAVLNNNTATAAWCWPNQQIKYHIHNSWNMSAGGSSLTQCGATPTGGHWDPWFACGSATGSTASCGNKNGCIARTYACNSANFMADPSACEIGDWSGKYGLGIVNQATRMATLTSAMSRWEADAKSLTGKSIVLHCGTGERFACAKFVVSMTGGMAKPMMSYDYSTRYVADFGSIGGPQVYFGGSTIQYSNMFSCPSNTVASVMMYNAWNAPNMMALSGSTMCVKAKVGMVYDPYFSCVMGSEKMTECGYDTTTMKSTRCTNQIDYAANCAMSPYYCAAGDITGRVSAPTGSGMMNVTDYLLPTMTSGSVVVKCGTQMWCAKIRKADMAYVADTPPTTTTTATPAATSASSLTVISTGAFLVMMAFFVN